MTDPLALVYEHDEIADLDPAARRLALRDIFMSAGVDDVPGWVGRAADEIDGFGPLAGLMRDDALTDILINGPEEVWIERDGCLTRVASPFTSAGQLTTWCERAISRAGARIDTAHPIADARLEDGSRLHVVLPPVAPGGPLVSIRRFPKRRFILDDLVGRKTLDARQATRLRAAVADGRSIVVSGATGAGKTTLLGALLSSVPAAERVVVIEELPELPHGNGVSLVARTANAEGAGEVSLETLVRAALRMRPDRIVVGEVRGPEALPALWAMRTGHAGTMLSVHAADAVDAARRLVDLALMAERTPSETSLLREVGSAVDVYVHMSRRDGVRKVEEIVER
jgi:pilus assembly protein CpaF